MANAWDSDWNPKVVAEPNLADRTIRANQRVDDGLQFPARVNPISFNNDILHDWSRLGYTSARHVDLQTGSLPPGFVELEELGKSNSVVKKVEVLGTILAMKKYKVETVERQSQVLAEISILRRLRHHHIIEYVGSMRLINPATPQNPTLSALFWPVAPCSLDRFFLEIDTLAAAICQGELKGSETADSIRNGTYGSAVSLLRKVVYPGGAERNKRTSRVDTVLRAAISRLFASFGCLAEALSYVHRQRVSHKDIKPSNILIYPNEATYQSTESNPQGEIVRDGLRLTDFDGAKDHSQALISTTEHNWYSSFYASPETRKNQKSGRSADIFSLGCVYLEMLALASIYPHLTSQTRSSKPAPYFSKDKLLYEIGLEYLARHAETGKLPSLVNRIGESLPALPARQRKGTLRLQSIIQSMLEPEPADRPPADRVLLQLSAADFLRDKSPGAKEGTLDSYPLFGKCCARFSLSMNEAQELLLSKEEADLAAEAAAAKDQQPDNDPTTPRTETPTSAIDKEPNGGTTPRTPIAPSLSSTEDDDENPDQDEPRPSTDLADESPTTAFTIPPVSANQYTIQWNQYGQRIDPPTVEYNWAAFDRIKKLELCRWRYLRGVCQNVDTCSFKHNYDLSQRDLEILRALIRRQKPCDWATRCTNSACFAGHNCPNLRPGTAPEDRTKTSKCCYNGPEARGGRCIFPPEMHDMDIKVAYRTER